MSGKLARERGRKFEVEAAKIFSEALGREFKRKLGQARDSGNDIDVGPLVVEVKRVRELGFLARWFEQAEAAASRRMRDNPDALVIPAVVTRGDGLRPVIMLDLHDFLHLTRDTLNDYIDEHERK